MSASEPDGAVGASAPEPDGAVSASASEPDSAVSASASEPDGAVSASASEPDGAVGAESDEALAAAAVDVLASAGDSSEHIDPLAHANLTDVEKKQSLETEQQLRVILGNAFNDLGTVEGLDERLRGHHRVLGLTDRDQAPVRSGDAEERTALGPVAGEGTTFHSTPSHASMSG